MKRTAAAVALLTILVNGAALAQTDERLQPGRSGSLFSGTPEEQAACRPDSTKYCLDEMPDSLRVLACLQQHRTKLRKACLQVLEAHGQ
ncbi:hypothetical protein DW352_22690 [Pseudolabrys taiwanensis]|uniref:Cysteine rich repeat-containing protein n=1 Tax=Pseudolabrys taiwanensis TaxID=331696 RepID=A0A346A1N0_9HYPH|nr:cysteine rich repeat-containing protein [Pseudolabrys taiwanensis]AXK83077.1 hypothetical protein DW352_22690 [Pseudolabrys taiwanensis]